MLAKAAQGQEGEQGWDVEESCKHSERSESQKHGSVQSLFFSPFQNLFVFASLIAVHLLTTINHMTFYKRKLKYEKIPIKMFTIESDTIKIIHCIDRLRENIVNWLSLLVSEYCPQCSY